jgi:hypothetical protein
MIALDPEYRAHPMEIFTLATLRSAGIFFGGFLLALVFAYFYMRAQDLPVLATWVALAVAAGGAWLVFMPRAEAQQEALSH